MAAQVVLGLVERELVVQELVRVAVPVPLHHKVKVLPA